MLLDILVSSIISFQCYVVMTFDLCSLHRYLGCPGQRDTIKGYSIVKSIYISCNRTVSYLKYSEGPVFLENKFLAGSCVAASAYSFSKFVGLTIYNQSSVSNPKWCRTFILKYRLYNLLHFLKH